MRLTNYDATQIKQTEEYGLRDDMTITIQALPPDYDDKTEDVLPSPQPPRLGVEKDAKGKTVFGEDGRPVQRYNEQDPDYVRSVSRTNKLQGVRMVLEGLAPGQMDFDATMGEDAAAYYGAVLIEMREFGLSLGDIIGMMKAITKLSGISAEDMKAAELGFIEEETEED